MIEYGVWVLAGDPDWQAARAHIDALGVVGARRIPTPYQAHCRSCKRYRGSHPSMGASHTRTHTTCMGGRTGRIVIA